MIFRDAALAAAVLGCILVAAPPSATTSSSRCGTATPPLPLAANYSRVSYGSGGTVILR